MEYDVLILGGGPAGLTAAIYAARGGLKAAVLEKQFCGGLAVKADLLENYPGFPEGINGADLGMAMQAQAERLGAEIINDEALSVTGRLGAFTVRTAGGEWSARAVILALGSYPLTLGLPEEASYLGRGVSYCATCDGALFRGKPVAIVGGGDSAVSEALYLARFAAKVYLIHRRDTLRAAKMLQDRAFANEKIEMVWNATVEKISGEPAMEALTLRTPEGAREISVNALFVAIGNKPDTDFIKGFVPTDEKGYILANDHMGTATPGVFAAGDARKKNLRQVVTAAADGALAAEGVIEALSGIQS